MLLRALNRNQVIINTDQEATHHLLYYFTVIVEKLYKPSAHQSRREDDAKERQPAWSCCIPEPCPKPPKAFLGRH